VAYFEKTRLHDKAHMKYGEVLGRLIMRNLLPILLSLFSSPPLLSLSYTNLGVHAFVPKLFPSTQGILLCGRSDLNFGKEEK
jgi:hypothetical protein